MDNYGEYKNNNSTEDRFFKEEIVFKILTVSDEKSPENKGMVNTKEDYDLKIKTHIYNPLLFIIDLKLRLAYLYGCLNKHAGISGKESYIFYWREIGTNDWYEWYKVGTYEDSFREMVNVIEES